MHTYEEKEEVPVEETIRSTLTSTSVSIQQKNEYIVIDAPNRQESNAKYVVTAPFCHWI